MEMHYCWYLRKFSFDGGSLCNNINKLTIIRKIKIVRIAAGNTHSMCLDNTGNICTFGSNDMRQLGLGKYEIIQNNALMKQTPQNNQNENDNDNNNNNEQ